MPASLIRNIYRGWTRNESFWDTLGMNENLRRIGDHIPLNIKYVGNPRPSFANEGECWIDEETGQYAVWSTGANMQSAAWNTYAPAEGLIGYSSSDGKMWGNTGSSWEDSIEMVVGSSALQTAIANAPLNLKDCDGKQIPLGASIPTCSDMDDAISTAIGSLSFTVPDSTEATKGKIRIATVAEATAGTNTTAAVTPAGLAAAVPSATESTKGKVELATVLEATAGTDTTRAVTPAGLSAAISAAGGGSVTPDATESVKGKVELATVAEATAGTDTTRAVTPAGLSAAISAAGGGSITPDATETVKGKVELATVAEATAGTDTTRAVTPAGLAAAISASGGGGGAASASFAETLAGTIDNKYVSPSDLKYALTTNQSYEIVTAHTYSSSVLTPTRTSLTMGSSQSFSRLGTADGSTITGPQGIIWESSSPKCVGTLGYSAAGSSSYYAVFGEALSSNYYAGFFKGKVKFDPSEFVYGNSTSPSKSNIFSSGGIGYEPISAGSGGVTINISGSGLEILSLNRAGSDGPIQKFFRQGSEVGNIAVTSTATTYNSTSDYRLKTVKGALKNSGKFIDALKPREGEWKSEPGKRAAFFVAHELQEVSPTSVVGEKDAVDENGNPIMQSVAYGSAEMIVNMIAELQELRKRVANLESK